MGWRNGGAKPGSTVDLTSFGLANAPVCLHQFCQRLGRGRIRTLWRKSLMSETLIPTLDMTGNTLAGLPRSTVESMVRAEAEGEADDTTLALLNGDPARWASMLLDLIEDT